MMNGRELGGQIEHLIRAKKRAEEAIINDILNKVLRKLVEEVRR